MALFGVTPVAAGVSVTPKTAMTCAPVKAAVQAIAEAIGQLPVHTYRRIENGKVRAPDHPTYKLLHDEANDWTPAGTLREAITRDALTHDGGYAYINRVNDKPIELTRSAPRSLSPFMPASAWTKAIPSPWRSCRPFGSALSPSPRRQKNPHPPNKPF